MRTPLLLLLLAALLACSSGDRRSVGGGADGSGNCPVVGDLTVSFVSTFGGAGICQLSGTLTQNAVLTAGVDWRLQGLVQVGDESSNPVLTVEAGAAIRGDIENTVVDVLYVVPGAELQSLGRRDAPVIFSSNDDGYDADPLLSGEWGGIVIEEHALAPGSSNARGSRLEYTIVAEAGAAVTIGSNSYEANISLHGPHAATRLHYLHSYASGTDGISFTAEPGNSNLARAGWMLVTGSSRDGVYYKNFEGLIKNLLLVHGPGQYSNVTGQGGRAGIRAAGTDVSPLVVNATLFGNDNDSEDGFGLREMGILFEDGANRARMANIAIVNFRNGCYEVGDDIGEDVDLGSMQLQPMPEDDTNFVDGVHCVNEFTGDDLLGVVRSGGVDIPDGSGGGEDLQGFNENGAGIQGYSSGGNAIFASETGTVEFTASWYLQSLAGLVNGSGGLNRYNGGNTDGDASGNVNSTDENFLPLFNSNNDPVFSGVFDSSASSGGFDLTVIGAVRSSDPAQAGQFDDWTLHSGAVDPVVLGFQL